jgi:uncharacterized membrane protein YhaH (DUF805 family)
MLILRTWSAALFTPWGRLSPVPYALLAFALIAVHTTLQMTLTAHAEDWPAYNPYSTAQVALIWMFFAISSRRFHDAGKTAFFLMPLMMATIAASLYAIEQSPLALSTFVEDQDVAQFADRIRMLVQIAGLVALGGGICVASDGGTNAFGPPFHARGVQPKEERRQRQQTDAPGWDGVERRQSGLRPPSAATAAPKSPPALKSGEIPLPTTRRGQITPGQTASRSASGFGRR